MQPHEVSADMAALSPEACDYVRQLARRLDEAEHGSGTAMVREAGEFLGLSVQTVYRHLKAVAGWSSGRKARSDKGSTSVSADALVTLGAVPAGPAPGLPRAGPQHSACGRASAC